MGAEKLIVLTDVPGVVNENSELISSLSEDKAEDLINRGIASGGMVPKIRCCLTALRGGVPKAHVIDGRVPHALLLEILTVMLVAGERCKVTDSDGRTYLDFIGGLAACCLGHGHKALAQAISEQAKKLIHVSNLFYIEPQIKLAKLLTENSFAEKVFFCNSGAEANEAAIKLAKILSRSRGASTLSDHYHGGIVPSPNPRHLGCHGPNKIQAGFPSRWLKAFPMFLSGT